MKNKDRINIYIAHRMGYRVKKLKFDSIFDYFELVSPDGKYIIEPYYDDYLNVMDLTESEMEAWDYVPDFVSNNKRKIMLVEWLANQNQEFKYKGNAESIHSLFTLKLIMLLNISGNLTSSKAVLRILQATPKQVAKAAFHALRCHEKTGYYAKAEFTAM